MEGEYTIDQLIQMVHEGRQDPIVYYAAYEGILRIDINQIYQGIVDTINRECGEVWANQFAKEMRALEQEMKA